MRHLSRRFPRLLGYYRLIRRAPRFAWRKARSTLRIAYTKQTNYLGQPFFYPFDSFIGEHIRAGGEWDAVLVDIVNATIPGDRPVLCEIGSNIGASTLQLLKAKPLARLLLVEPSDRFRPFLARNIAPAVRGGAEMRIVPLVMSRQEGTGWLYNNETTASYIRNYAGHEGRGKQRVEVSTVDALLAGWPSVDLLKIDTDGEDFEVLRGAVGTLQRDQPVLFIEFAPSLLNDPIGDLGWLAGQGYRRYLCLEPGQQGRMVGVTQDPTRVLEWARLCSYCDIVVCHVGDSGNRRIEALADHLNHSGRVRDLGGAKVNRVSTVSD